MKFGNSEFHNPALHHHLLELLSSENSELFGNSEQFKLTLKKPLLPLFAYLSYSDITAHVELLKNRDTGYKKYAYPGPYFGGHKPKKVESIENFSG